MAQKVIAPKAEKMDPGITKIVFAVLVGFFGPLINTSTVNVAIKSIGEDLHADASSASWVITVYVLALGIMVPVTGWLPNRFDTKRVYLWGIVAFTIGSIFCAIPVNLLWLIFGRVVQGASAGVLIPLMTNILMRLTPESQRTSLMSVVGLPAVLFPIFGPVIAGAILAILPWTWIFWINVPLGILAFIVNWKALPNQTPLNSKLRLDFAGVIMLCVGFIALIMGVSELKAQNSGAFFVAGGLLIFGAVLLLSYVLYASKAKHAVALDMHIFKKRAISMSIFQIFSQGAVSLGFTFLIPLSTLSYEGLNPDEIPHSTTASRMMQQIGGALGTAGLSMVLTYGLNAHTSGSYVSIFQMAFHVLSALSIVSMLLAFFYARDRV